MTLLTFNRPSSKKYKGLFKISFKLLSVKWILDSIYNNIAFTLSIFSYLSYFQLKIIIFDIYKSIDITKINYFVNFKNKYIQFRLIQRGVS